MIKQSRNFRVLKWISLIIALLLIGAIIYFYVLYTHVQGTKTDSFPATEQFVLNETELVTIDEIAFFQEIEPYHIVSGSDGENRDFLVYVSILEETPEIEAIYSVEDILSQARILSNWEKECARCELKNSTLAMIDKQALWELTYIDNKNRYVMDYFNLFTGERYEQLRLSRN